MPDSFTVFIYFLLVFLGGGAFGVFYIQLYKIMSFTNRGSFTSFQFGYLLLILFLPNGFLTWLGLNTLLRKGGESRHPHRVSDLRGKVFNLPQLS